MSDGQRAQVAKNEERVASLQAEVETIEEEIRAKNNQRADSRSKMGGGQGKGGGRHRVAPTPHPTPNTRALVCY